MKTIFSTSPEDLAHKSLKYLSEGKKNFCDHAKMSFEYRVSVSRWTLPDMQDKMLKYGQVKLRGLSSPRVALLGLLRA
jgi:hypothetical protein